MTWLVIIGFDPLSSHVLPSGYVPDHPKYAFLPVCSHAALNLPAGTQLWKNRGGGVSYFDQCLHAELQTIKSELYKLVLKNLGFRFLFKKP